MKWAALVLLFALSSYADSPFPRVEGRSLISGVDDCSATKVLEKAILSSGVNVLDGKNRETWTCTCKAIPMGSTGDCPGGSTASRIFLNNCQAGESIKCYANGADKSQTLCVQNPRVVEFQKTYADVAGKITEHRARFQKIYTLRTDAGGYSVHESWQMDAQGCQPTAYSDGSGPNPDAEACRKEIGNYFGAKTIFGLSDSTSYCDGGKTAASRSSQISALRYLGECLEAYPQLDEEFSFERKPNNSRIGGPGQR